MILSLSMSAFYSDIPNPVRVQAKLHRTVTLMMMPDILSKLSKNYIVTKDINVLYVNHTFVMKMNFSVILMMYTKMTED